MTKAASLLPFALAAAACSSSSSSTDSSLTVEDYDDTAQAVASVTVAGSGGGDVASMSDSATIALGVLPIGFSLDGSGEISGNRFGVEYSYAITCEDAAGNDLDVCTSLTDRAAVDVAWSGNLDLPNFTSSVSREGSWSIAGLQSDTAVFGGESEFSYDATIRSIFRPSSASFTFDAHAEYDGVAIDTATHDAIAGSASFDLSARKVVTGTENDVDKSFEVHADVEFHADRTATLLLDGEHRYTLNVATGAVVRAN
jgi:hypothetical protein